MIEREKMSRHIQFLVLENQQLQLREGYGVKDPRRISCGVAKKHFDTGHLGKGHGSKPPAMRVAERTAILTAREGPNEAPTVGAAIATLRRWQRWKKCAEELQASTSEPVLAKGLSRLMKKLPLGGLLMTYVADLFITGPRFIVDALKRRTQEMWKTSGCEDLSCKLVRFSRMEVS